MINEKEPYVIVAESYEHYVAICKYHDWDSHLIRYINIRDDDKLQGYYYEDVYPEWVAIMLDMRRRSPATAPGGTDSE